MNIDDALRDRRSIRRYTAESIPRDLLVRLLDAAIWALAAWLARRARGGVLGVAGWGLVAVAAALEAAQLLVLSRVVDTTDIVAAAVGVGLAGLLPDDAATGPATGHRRVQATRLAVPALVAAALLALHTWPFDFATDAQALRTRLATLNALPFASYATNTELYLVTNVLRRVAQFAAFAALCLWSLEPWRLSRVASTGAATVATVALAAAIEGLQVFLPQRVVDTGDLGIAAVVAALTAWLWPGAATATRPAGAVPGERSASSSPRAAAARPPAPGGQPHGTRAAWRRGRG